MFTSLIHIAHFLYTRETFSIDVNIFQTHDVYFSNIILNIFQLCVEHFYKGM